MYSTVRMENNIARDNEILLEKYDKEFGLEIGSNKELVDCMQPDNTLLDEMEKEYSTMKNYFTRLCKFFFTTHESDIHDEEHGDSDSEEDRVYNYDTHDAEIGFHNNSDFNISPWITRPDKWGMIATSIYSFFVKKKEN
jgi:hypothetical protein